MGTVKKIEWTGESVFVPAIGTTKAGAEYTIAEKDANNLIRQGLAVAAKPEKIKKGGLD